MADAPTTPSLADTKMPPITGPKFQIKSQYIKDLSFENPKAPEIFQQAGSAPEITLNIDVRARPLEIHDDYEVVLSLEARALVDGEPWFILELSYAGVISLAGVSEGYIQPILLIESPRLLFPFVRNIVADTTRDSGFPPLLLQPIDFTTLFQDKQKELERAQVE